MKTLKILVALMLLCCSTVEAKQAVQQYVWKRTAPTNRGIITNIEASLSNPQHIFAATYGDGVYRSDDEGQSWIALGKTGLSDPFISEVTAIDDQTLFLRSDTCLYRSNDGGEHWNKIFPEAKVRQNNTNDIYINPMPSHQFSALNQDHVFLVNKDQNVYYTSDAGKSWATIHPNFPSSTIGGFSSIVALTPTELVASTWASGLMQSNDAGKDWKFINNGLTDTGGYAAIEDYAVINQNEMLAYTARNGMLKTIDGGAHWNPINTGLPSIQPSQTMPKIAIHFLDTSHFVLAIGNTLFETNNAGKTWNPISAPHDNSALTAYMVSDRDLLIGTDGAGIFHTTDQGAHWSQSKGLSAAFVNVIKPIDANTVYAGLYGGGLLKTDDAGDTWTALNKGLTNLSVNAISTLDNQTLYVGTDAGVFRSNDGGQHFTSINNGIGSKKIDSVLAVTASTLLVGTEDSLYMSQDSGKSWFPIPEFANASPIATMLKQGKRLTFTVGGFSPSTLPNHFLFRSNDSGQTWEADDSVMGKVSLDYARHPVLSEAPGSKQYMVLGDNLYEQDLTQSTQWAQLNTTIPKGVNYSGVVLDGAYVIVSAHAEEGIGEQGTSYSTMGVYFSDDNAKSWSPMNTGLSSKAIRTMKIFNHTVYVGTAGSGISQLTLPATIKHSK